jgi:hypothetical protein
VCLGLKEPSGRADEHRERGLIRVPPVRLEDMGNDTKPWDLEIGMDVDEAYDTFSWFLPTAHIEDETPPPVERLYLH